MATTAHIHIHCYASLKPLEPPGAAAHPIRPGTTVADLLRELAIAPGQIKLIFVNGRRADAQTALQAGDRLGLFPPVGGG
mgnify:CR=1 FL=1